MRIHTKGQNINHKGTPIQKWFSHHPFLKIWIRILIIFVLCHFLGHNNPYQFSRRGGRERRERGGEERGGRERGNWWCGGGGGGEGGGGEGVAGVRGLVGGGRGG